MLRSGADGCHKFSPNLSYYKVWNFLLRKNNDRQWLDRTAWSGMASRSIKNPTSLMLLQIRLRRDQPCADGELDQFGA